MFIIPLQQIQYGLGYIPIRSPYTPFSVFSKGTIPPGASSVVNLYSQSVEMPGVIIRAFGVRRAWDGILGTRGLKLGQRPRCASNDRHNTSSRKPKP